MQTKYSTYYVLLAVCGLFCCGHNLSYADDGYELWMKYNQIEDAARLAEYQQTIISITVEGQIQTCRIIRDELKRGLGGLLGKEIPIIESSPKNGSLIIGTPTSSAVSKEFIETSELEPLGREGFIIKSIKNSGNNMLVIAANDDIGLLYGTFCFLRLIQTESILKNINIISRPMIQYRLLNHWDNLNGTVERGYAGKSLWKWDQLPKTTDPRYTDYARADASL